MYTTHDPGRVSRPRRFARARTAIVSVAVAAAVASAAPSAAPVPAHAAVPATPTGWQLVWSDDFNGAANTLLGGLRRGERRQRPGRGLDSLTFDPRCCGKGLVRPGDFAPGGA